MRVFPLRIFTDEEPQIYFTRNTLKESYQLFSDEIKKGDQQALYFSFLANVQKVFKNIRLYPPTHKLVTTSVTGLVNSCNQLFEYHQCLVVVKIGDKLITPKFQISMDDPQIADLANVLEMHHVRKLRFWNGISEEDIIGLCNILAMKPLMLLNSGGPKFLLSQENISSIEIDLASHLDASGEDGTAGLTEFMGQGSGNRKNWLAGLKKAGIEETPFIDYLLHRGAKNTMIQREIQLAVQVFSDSRAVAELLVFLSADPDNPKMISLGKMFNIMQRLENVILMHSSQDGKDVARQLEKSARLLDSELRLKLLKYYCHSTLKNKIITSVKLFSFDFPEYYQVIMKEYRDHGTLKYVSSLRLTKKKLDELIKYFRKQLINERLPESFNINDFLEKLFQAAKINYTAVPGIHVSELSEVNSDFLNFRFENLQSNLELGYLHVLTNLLVPEKEEERIMDICVRLASLLDLYLRKKDYDTLIPIFKQFTKLDSSSVEIFNKVFWKKLKPDQVSAISNLFFEYSSRNQKESAGLLLALNKYLPKEFIPAFVLRVIRQKTLLPYQVISQLLHSRETENRLYSELLNSKDIDDKLTAFDLLAMRHNREAEHMLLESLQKKSIGRACRLAIISILSSFRGPSSGSVLARIAAGNERYGLSANIYRIAAVEAMGVRNEAAAVPVLEHLISRRNLWRRNKNHELRFGVAYVLSMNKSIRAALVLEKNFDKLQRPLLRYVIDRIKSVIHKYLLLAKRIIMAVISPFIYMVTVVLNVVKSVWSALCKVPAIILKTVKRILKPVIRPLIKLFRLIIDGIKNILILLCKLPMIIIKMFSKIIKYTFINIWVAVKYPFVTLSGILKKRQKPNSNLTNSKKEVKK